MRFHPDDWVTVTDTTTVDVGNETVRFPAGMRLQILDVKPGAVKVIDVDNAEPVWIPDTIVRAAK